MNVLISSDVEGVCGVDDYEYINGLDKNKLEQGKKWVTEELNVLIDVCFEKGAKKVMVVDGHGKGDNIIMNLLDDRAMILRKHEYRMIEGITDNVNYLILQGYHGKPNVANSFTAHSYSSFFFSEVRVNGRSVGESELNAMVAKQLGIKTILLTGTKEAINECQIKGLKTVETKESLSWSTAQSYDQKVVLKEMKEKCEQAFDTKDSIDYIDDEIYNVEIEVELNHLAIAELLAYPRINPKTISFDAPSIEDAYLELMRIAQNCKKLYSTIY